MAAPPAAPKNDIFAKLRDWKFPGFVSDTWFADVVLCKKFDDVQRVLDVPPEVIDDARDEGGRTALVHAIALGFGLDNPLLLFFLLKKAVLSGSMYVKDNHGQNVLSTILAYTDQKTADLFCLTNCCCFLQSVFASGVSLSPQAASLRQALEEAINPVQFFDVIKTLKNNSFTISCQEYETVFSGVSFLNGSPLQLALNRKLEDIRIYTRILKHSPGVLVKRSWFFALPLFHSLHLQNTDVFDLILEKMYGEELLAVHPGTQGVWRAGAIKTFSQTVRKLVATEVQADMPVDFMTHLRVDAIGRMGQHFESVKNDFSRFLQPSGSSSWNSEALHLTALDRLDQLLYPVYDDIPCILSFVLAQGLERHLRFVIALANMMTRLLRAKSWRLDNGLGVAEHGFEAYRIRPRYLRSDLTLFDLMSHIRDVNTLDVLYAASETWKVSNYLTDSKNGSMSVFAFAVARGSLEMVRWCQAKRALEVYDRFTSRRYNILHLLCGGYPVSEEYHQLVSNTATDRIQIAKLLAEQMTRENWLGLLYPKPYKDPDNPEKENCHTSPLQHTDDEELIQVLISCTPKDPKEQKKEEVCAMEVVT